MELSKNVPHKFELSGLKPGQCFLGCGDCWYRLDPDEMSGRKCPECGGTMKLFHVTAVDV